MSSNFALIGAAGYIAPRHLKAIRDSGNILLAAADPYDSVGILDSYFPNAKYFPEIERFDRHLDKLRRMSDEERIHYVSICSPNYLHDAHVRLALRIEAHAICEKPLVINPWNLDALKVLEEETGRKVYTILQLRVYPSLMQLKETLELQPPEKKVEVVLTYITGRGSWYNISWKGSLERSGGLATNIGIHFFDLLIWLFGEVKKYEVYLNDQKRMVGFLELKKANVHWFLSVDMNDLPFLAKPGSNTTYRSLTIDGKELEFTDGFTDLHTRVYEKILSGHGYGIEDARPSIELAYNIRTSELRKIGNYAHPFFFVKR
jgi:UDP-N-acetyl-2-amino-2-deoxyglucuronate dehydrogenase